MKRWFTTALFTLIAIAVAGALPAAAQDVYLRGGGVNTSYGAPNYPLISGFESIEEDTTLWGQYGFWDEGSDCRYQGPPCWDFYEGQRDYAILFDYAGAGYNDAPQGESAVLIDWGVFSDNSWGGSSAFQHQLPDSVITAGTFYDFSDFIEIGIDYNNLAPTGEGALFRIKINEASEGDRVTAGGFEDWYSESNVMLEAQPGWGEVFIPLDMVDGCCGTGGFNRPGWSGVTGNDFFDTDKIAGFQLEFVAPSSATQGDSAIAGTVVWDNFRVRGERYGVNEAFEGAADGSWKNSTAGSFTITASDDHVEGSQSIQVDFNIVGDQGWGGNVEIQGNAEGGYYPVAASNTHISLFYRVLTPSALPEAILTMKIFDESNGEKEQWNYETKGAPNDDSGQWRRLLIPLKDVFHPSWEPLRDGVFDQTKISEIRLELYVAEGNTSTGTILFDRLSPYGFQETDYEAPAAPTGLAADPSVFSNIVSWTDVPDETGETYTLYASQAPITDVAAPGVMLVKTGIAEGTEIFTHQLYHPVVDHDLSLYYALSATDAVGNVGPATALATPVTTTAKGMSTISIGTPPSFAADGDLSEWAGLTPFHLEYGTEFGFDGMATGLTPSADDLSMDFWLAMDEENLYFAAEVTDDVVDSWTGTGNHYQYDEIQLYIGLFDRNTTYSSGRRGWPVPDYEISMVETQGGFSSLTWPAGSDPAPGDGTGFYSWVETANGYNVEFKIPFTVMQRDGQPSPFVPVEGMRLPLDISLHDDDTDDGQATQDFILTFSSTNENLAYTDVSRWLYTWIGEKYSVVGVERVDTDVPQVFNLHPNYPNPFNPTTVFRYDLPEAGPVTLRVFNMLGQEVRTLIDGMQAAGTYEVQFDAQNLASGMYLYQLRSGRYTQTRKMMLVR